MLVEFVQLVRLILFGVTAMPFLALAALDAMVPIWCEQQAFWFCHYYLLGHRTVMRAGKTFGY